MTNPVRDELVKIADEIEAYGFECEGGLLKNCKPWQELKRRLASSEDGVKVRELEWGPYPNPVFACDDVAVADITAFGGHKYQVQRDPNAAGYIAFLAPQFGSLFWESKGHATLDAAKAAAQRDYETRIRSALVEVPAVKGEPEPVAWPSDGSCVRCGAVPRTASGLCNTCLDEDAERYENAHPADAGMREALDQLRKEADSAYCRFLDKMSSKPCLGHEAKIRNGTFGVTELEAHRNAKELLGFHRGIYHAIKALTAPGATTKSDGGERDR